MTNKARIWYPNAAYHITARGNRRNDIFRDKEDFEVYIILMEEAKKYYNDEYIIICYCLMDNHIHLLIETKEKHIKYYMTRLNSIYARYFNNKYNYIGRLYQDRYFSEHIENTAQMLETSRYIHLNPVRARMVSKPEQYQWSSYGMYIGLNKEKLISSEKVLACFKKENDRELYKEFVESAIKQKLEDKEEVI